MGARDLPPMERVSRRRRVEPALLVLVAGIALITVAVWKPWLAPSSNAASMAPGTFVPTGRSAGVTAPESPAEGGMGPSAASSASEPTTVAGLIWDTASARDAHRNWGVAMAYLPLGQIDDALVLRHSGMAPTLRWVSTTPGTPPRAMLGAQGAPVVALAVTWPSDMTPLDVTLRFLGRLPIHRPSPAPWIAPGRPVALSAPVPFLLEVATPRGHDSLDPATMTSWALISGTYFQPPDAHATGIIDWLSRGWPPGRYEFDLRRGVGRELIVPFDLDSGV